MLVGLFQKLKMAVGAAALGTNNASSCPKPMKATSNGAFQHENPLDYALPLLILQICLVVIFTRGLALLLKPLRQPRVIAEVIGGILLGPSAIGRSETFLHTVFPAKSMPVLDTIANIGLVFFLFLVGLELDLHAIRRTGKEALAIAAAGISFPFVLGIGTSFALRATVAKGGEQGPFLVFMGVSLSITAFPVLARILAELKLLTTDVGRMAMSAAAVNDVAAWILLALAIALSGTGTSPFVAIWVLLCGAAFIFFAAFVIRPALVFMARRSLEGEPVKETFICATLVIVLGAGFVTDTIGIHVLFGAFVVGIVVPKDGTFAGVLIEKIEDLVSGLLLPLYFVSSGLKTNIATIQGGQSWALLVLVIFTACFGKIVGTLIVAMIFKMPRREALALGFLMNTKGLVELIVLNIGKDRKVLNDQTFAILVLMALFTTFITTPIVMAVYKPARQAALYNHRTIQRKKDGDSELRILACFHSSRNIPSMINLIESSRGTRRHRLCVYAMHLMELSERSSAISMVNKARRNGLPFWNNKKNNDGGDHIVIAFEAYQQLSTVSIRPMTAISAFQTIHEDICVSAQDKRTALILLPFHKHQRVDGGMESLGHSIHLMNQQVLRHAPCSVAIVIDRGLGGTSQVSASDVSFKIVSLFFGGHDDREALAYGVRMAEHPGIALTVMRLLPKPGKSLMGTRTSRATNPSKSSPNKSSTSPSKQIVETRMEEEADERRADDELLNDFKAGLTESTSYEEKAVEDRDEILGALKEMNNKFNLFLVGRMPHTEHLLDRTDCPELGPVGSFLASSEFSTVASVIVIQQYNPAANLCDHDQLMEETTKQEIHHSELPV